MYQACIFDMDGTILNTLDSIAYFGNQALKTLGFGPISTPEYKTLVGNGVEVLVRRMLETAGGNPANSGLRTALRQTYDHLYEENPNHLVAPYPGILSLLSQLKSENIRLGVLSNKPDNMVRFLASHFFPDSFHAVQGQLANIPTKPDPLSLTQMISALGCSPKQVLYCGDSGVDMLTGKNAGVKSCGVLWGFRSREELTENGADFLAENPGQLLAIIKANKI